MPRRRMPSDWASLARHLLLQTRVRGFRGGFEGSFKGLHRGYYKGVHKGYYRGLGV